MSSTVIININNIEDIKKINNDTKYINFSIDNISADVIDYFLLNGQNFFYSSGLKDKEGFVFADYNTFKNGELVVTNIIDNLPLNLNNLEKIRYLYITLGRGLNIDINTIESKNDSLDFRSISSVGNIWSSMCSRSVNEDIISRIFMYLCSRLNIKSEIIYDDNYKNKIYIDEEYITVSLYQDMHNIQGGFITEYFDNYNDNIEVDKKIGYIKDDYMNNKLDSILNRIKYDSDSFVFDVLSLTSRMFQVRNMGSLEMAKIYRGIFDKYCSQYKVGINNFFLNNSKGQKKHFVLISYEDKIYSFDYDKGCFVKMNIEFINYNLKINKMGIYKEENFNFKEKGLIV